MCLYAHTSTFTRAPFKKGEHTATLPIHIDNNSIIDSSKPRKKHSSTNKNKSRMSDQTLPQVCICFIQGVTFGYHLVATHECQLFSRKAFSDVNPLVTTENTNGLEESTADKLTRLQGLLTQILKSFARFNRSTCALSVSCHYNDLWEIHLTFSLWNHKQSYSLSKGKQCTYRPQRRWYWTLTNSKQVSSKPLSHTNPKSDPYICASILFA